MHFLGIVQWDSTRRDHPRNPGRVFGSGLVSTVYEREKNMTNIQVQEIKCQ